MSCWRLVGLVLAVSFAMGCGDDESDVGGAGNEAACGAAKCSAAEYCCDAQCGLCVEQGVACTESCP